jgi:F0F1-type ATP synthase membrane subunit c/vacuolar-type H+-ATPase subunit K
MNGDQERYKQVNAAVEKFVQMSSTQAALLAGFAFTSITLILSGNPVSGRLVTLFIVLATLSSGCGLLCLSIYLLLTFVTDKDILVEKFSGELAVASFFYLAEIITFAAASVLLTWVKLPLVAPWITGVTLLLLGVGIFMYVHTLRKNRRIESSVFKRARRCSYLKTIIYRVTAEQTPPYSLKQVIPLAEDIEVEVTKWHVEIGCSLCTMILQFPVDLNDSPKDTIETEVRNHAANHRRLPS